MHKSSHKYEISAKCKKYEILFEFSLYLSDITLPSHARRCYLGKIQRPQRGAISLLGIYARAEHPAVIRQRVGHIDEGAVTPRSVKVDAAAGEQFALPFEEIR